MLQKRYLLSSFLYCVALQTKHTMLYYGFVRYFTFLLLNYCLIVSERGFSVKWSNSLKLVSIVIGSLFLCFPPFQVSASQYLLLALRR